MLGQIFYPVKTSLCKPKKDTWKIILKDQSQYDPKLCYIKKIYLAVQEILVTVLV